MGYAAPMALPDNVIHPKEKALKGLVFAVSGLAWAVVVCSLVGLCYGLAAIPFVLMAQAYFLGSIRGQGLKVSERQLPELYARIVRLSQALKLPSVPEVYVVQSGGALNAFATKLFSREYVILYSELIDSCSTDEELDFVVAHELGHHAAGHLKTLFFTLPVRLVPLLGPGYSRACEYTCDRAGLYAMGNLEQSQRALALLTAGKASSRKVDLVEFANQQSAGGEFWPAVAEAGSSHPFFAKRVAELSRWHAHEKGLPVIPAAPSRPVLSYVLAIFMSQQSFGLLIAIYVVAIVAAIAIPNFKKFQERARAANVSQQRPAAPAAIDELLDDELQDEQQDDEQQDDEQQELDPESAQPPSAN